MEPKPRLILLAEDNSDDAFLTTRAMEVAGVTHVIHHCRDGQEVVEYLEALLPKGEKQTAGPWPDLILLDLKMPRLSGLETLEWIRRHDILHSLIVVALTSSSEERDVQTAYHLKINAYLVKPSSLGEMIELAGVIRQFWLDQKHLIKPHSTFSSRFGVPPS